MGRTIDNETEAKLVDTLFTDVFASLAGMSQTELRISRIVSRQGSSIAAQFEAGFMLEEVVTATTAKTGDTTKRMRDEMIAALQKVHEKWRKGDYATALPPKRAAAPKKVQTESMQEDADAAATKPNATSDDNPFAGGYGPTAYPLQKTVPSSQPTPEQNGSSMVNAAAPPLPPNDMSTHPALYQSDPNGGMVYSAALEADAAHSSTSGNLIMARDPDENDDVLDDKAG